MKYEMMNKEEYNDYKYCLEREAEDFKYFSFATWFVMALLVLACWLFSMKAGLVATGTTLLIAIIQLNKMDRQKEKMKKGEKYIPDDHLWHKGISKTIVFK